MGQHVRKACCSLAAVGRESILARANLLLWVRVGVHPPVASNLAEFSLPRLGRFEGTQSGRKLKIAKNLARGRPSRWEHGLVPAFSSPARSEMTS